MVGLGRETEEVGVAADPLGREGPAEHTAREGRAAFGVEVRALQGEIVLDPGEDGGRLVGELPGAVMHREQEVGGQTHFGRHLVQQGEHLPGAQLVADGEHVERNTLGGPLDRVTAEHFAQGRVGNAQGGELGDEDVHEPPGGGPDLRVREHRVTREVAGG